MRLKATVEKDIDIKDVFDSFCESGGHPYNWWENYGNVLSMYYDGTDDYFVLKQNPKPVLKACLLLYADEIANYAENDLEKEIDKFNYGGNG